LLVVLASEVYTRNLRCIMEIFCFLAMGGSVDDIVVRYVYETDSVLQDHDNLELIFTPPLVLERATEVYINKIVHNLFASPYLVLKRLL